MEHVPDRDKVPPHAVPRAEPDPQGQAALLLVESLIHGLIANTTLSIQQAVEIIDVASEVKAEVAEARGENPAIMAESLQLLAVMSSSLRRDLRE